MKKWIPALLTLACILALMGCEETKPKDDPQQPVDRISQIDAEETYPEVPGCLAVIYEDIPQLMADADAIVYVSVDAQRVELPDGYPQVHTSVIIHHSYKGDAAVGGHINIIEDGGSEGTVLGGIPVLSPEHEYLLFLTEYNGSYYPCGAYQGRFILREGYLFQQATRDVKLSTYSPMPLDTFADQWLVA